ncbi:Vanadium-dependent bromoperoxidase 2 [Lutibaculum baratangense]|uniref:Vanadium-dependent bromoperoxidase 2 n=1 Tax=Lutibaculum baratangense AMV1 TaxID=631454 RepID=V4RQT0_9HYPH|nr:Vanadium-dependent bromoperoxidase 2 [Lutibaculum baratangense]ESR25490.1 Vanadium-dependent bromoperoxidase 2 [Lutibaculum baratangense AMV1]
MPIRNPKPAPAGPSRASLSDSIRGQAFGLAPGRGPGTTTTNGEEGAYAGSYVTNFTKGLEHDGCGLLKRPQDYERLVEAINHGSSKWFDNLTSSDPRMAPNGPVTLPKTFHVEMRGSAGWQKATWRAWESPRAGHATVAGGCVTILKAFFDTVDSDWKRHPWPLDVHVPTTDGARLENKGRTAKGETIEGELNKLAANVAIGRNMAGVHYYSDYYDSVRLGERVAVGILEEQMLTYGEEVRMRFHSFDSDRIEIDVAGNNSPPRVIVNDGGSEAYAAWWTRHL